MAESFDISKYITAADVVAAVTAGVVAYIRNRARPEEPQAVAQPGSFEECQSSFDAAMKSGKLFKQTNGYWTQYDDSGKAIGVFRQVRGGLCKYDVGADGTITSGTFFKPDGTSQALQQLSGANRAVEVWTNHHNAIAAQLQNGNLMCDPYTTTVGQDPDFDNQLLNGITKNLTKRMSAGGFQLSASDRSEALDMIMDYADTNNLTQAQVSSMVNRLGPQGLAKLAQLDDRDILADTNSILKTLAAGSTKALDQAWGKRLVSGTFSADGLNLDMDI